MRKKNILFVCVFALTIALLPACDLIEECGTCKLMTDINGNVTEGAPLPYCGDELKEKQNAAPVTVGNTTTWWECY
jgi:hypothetical protein